MHHLIAVMNVSERFACRVIGQHRSTQRHRPRSQTPTDPDAALREWLRQWAHNHPRWGFRRAYHAARAEGWYVNHKRLQRLWREEGLWVPQRRGRKRLGSSTTTTTTTIADAANRVWAVDLRRLRAASLVTYFPRAAFRCAEDTALRWVRSDATEAKV